MLLFALLNTADAQDPVLLGEEIEIVAKHARPDITVILGKPDTVLPELIEPDATFVPKIVDVAKDL